MNALAVRRPRGSFQPDVPPFDARPPFVDFGLLGYGERFRRLRLARENVLAEIGETTAHRRIGERIDDRSVQLCYDGPGRSPGRKQRLPAGEVESGQSRL